MLLTLQQNSLSHLYKKCLHLSLRKTTILIWLYGRIQGTALTLKIYYSGPGVIITFTTVIHAQIFFTRQKATVNKNFVEWIITYLRANSLIVQGVLFPLTMHARFKCWLNQSSTVKLEKGKKINKLCLGKNRSWKFTFR